MAYGCCSSGGANDHRAHHRRYRYRHAVAAQGAAQVKDREIILLSAEQYRRLEIAARKSGKSKSKWIEEMARALPFQKGQN
jgi:hypothetical protein